MRVGCFGFRLRSQSSSQNEIGAILAVLRMAVPKNLVDRGVNFYCQKCNASTSIGTWRYMLKSDEDNKRFATVMCGIDSVRSCWARLLMKFGVTQLRTLCIGQCVLKRSIR